MQQIKLLAISILFLVTNTIAQDTLIFDVKTKLFPLGELCVVKNESTTSNTIFYNLKSNFRVFSFYDIDYFMDATFSSGVLCYSSSSITVNGKSHHHSRTTLIDSVYMVITDDEETFTHTLPITTGVTPLYFGEAIGSDSIYSEYSGRYRPFVKQNDSIYILDPNNPMEFFFNEGKIIKVVVPNFIMDFYIILRH